MAAAAGVQVADVSAAEEVKHGEGEAVSPAGAGSEPRMIEQEAEETLLKVRCSHTQYSTRQ